jgi:hypothetical protein
VRNAVCKPFCFQFELKAGGVSNEEMSQNLGFTACVKCGVVMPHSMLQSDGLFPQKASCCVVKMNLYIFGTVLAAAAQLHDAVTAMTTLRVAGAASRGSHL